MLLDDQLIRDRLSLIWSSHSSSTCLTIKLSVWDIKQLVSGSRWLWGAMLMLHTGLTSIIFKFESCKYRIKLWRKKWAQQIHFKLKNKQTKKLFCSSFALIFDRIWEQIDTQEMAGVDSNVGAWKNLSVYGSHAQLTKLYWQPNRSFLRKI